MNLFGLIGHPLGHSFSKAYFTAKFEREGLDCEYQNFDLEDLSSLKQLVCFASFRGGTTKQPEGSSTEGRKSMLLGFNVTIPYKEAILPYLDELDPTAKEIGAVNTVKVFPDGKLMGYNTDTIGFESLLEKIASDNHHREEGATLRHCEGCTTEASIAVTSLVLGTGGASKAVQYVLKKNGIPFHLVSRDPKKGDLTYAQLTPDIIKEHLLIINTTPVGMAPHFDAAPDIPYEAITPDHILIDLIYNPEETLFLKNGREQGATTANGLTMLYAQAEASWKIWNDSSSLRGRHDRSNPSGAKPSTSPSISK